MQLIGDVLKGVADALKAAGINATTEQSELSQLPGAFVTPGTMDFDLLDEDHYSVDIEIFLITSGNDTNVNALNELHEMLNKLRSIYGVFEIVPQSFILPNISGPDPVPGLLITLQATIN